MIDKALDNFVLAVGIEKITFLFAIAVVVFVVYLFIYNFLNRYK